jgi:hypothetical protein
MPRAGGLYVDAGAGWHPGAIISRPGRGTRETDHLPPDALRLWTITTTMVATSQITSQADVPSTTYPPRRTTRLFPKRTGPN